MRPSESFEMFGNNFQTRVLQGVLIDHNFFETVYEILKPEYFNSEAHQAIWTEIRNFYEKYNAIPTYDSIKAEIVTYSDEFETLKSSAVMLLSGMKAKVNRKEVEHAQDKAFEFCRNKVMEAAILKSVQYLKKNKFDEIQKEIEESMKLTCQVDIGHDYFGQFGLRSKENVRNTIPTGFPIIDARKYMDGGLAPGELGVIMAPTGGGKSFWLVNLGFGALAQGHDVVHYTFELSETNVGWRYDARISEVPIKDIPEKASLVESRLNSFKGGRLFIKEYPVKSATINTIKFHIGRLMSSGFDPKLIILDYADLMRSRKGYEQKRFELESIYEDLRGFSQEMKLPIWTASQSNRGGFTDEIITLDKMGESISKAQVADFVASFSRTIEEKQRGLGKFFIAKNRFGDDGVWFPTTINTSNSYIAIGKKLEDDPSVEELVSKTLGGPDDVGGSSIMRELYKKHKDKV